MRFGATYIRDFTVIFHNANLTLCVLNVRGNMNIYLYFFVNPPHGHDKVP